MSMINYTPKEPTVAESASDILLREMDHQIARRIRTHKQMFDLLWNNPDATVDEIVAELGTKASLFFKLAGENIDHLARGAVLAGGTLQDYLADEEWMPPREVTHNADGTVTIGAEVT